MDEKVYHMPSRCLGKIPGMRTLCLSALLCAAWVQVSSAVPNSFFQGTGDEVSFRSFEDDAGGFYIAWADTRKGDTTALRAQHWSPQGEPLWEAGGLVVTSRLALAQDWSGLADGQGGLTP